jgi:recombinational DNA repair protein (RecF pathway)
MENKIVVIGSNASFEKCAYCGKSDELRPYGKDGARICYDCGMKPENKADTNAAIEKFLKDE